MGERGEGRLPEARARARGASDRAAQSAGDARRWVGRRACAIGRHLARAWPAVWVALVLAAAAGGVVWLAERQGSPDLEMRGPVEREAEQ